MKEYAFPGECADGMLLRDYFAGQALSGVIIACGKASLGIDAKVAARLAYGVAYEMMQYRSEYE